MAVDSTVLGTAGLAADVSGAGLRGFFAALPVLRLAPAVLATFFRATFFAPLPFVLCLAIDVPSSRAVFWDHIAHRSLVDPEGRFASACRPSSLGSCQLDSPTRRVEHGDEPGGGRLADGETDVERLQHGAERLGLRRLGTERLEPQAPGAIVRGVRAAVPFDEEGDQRPAAAPADEDVRPAYELAVGSRPVSLDPGGLISRGLRPGRRGGRAPRARAP